MSEFKKLLTTLEDHTCMLAQALNELQILKTDMEALKAQGDRPVYTDTYPPLPQTTWIFGSGGAG